MQDKFISMKRFCLALDLIDDPAKITEYGQWHSPENIWPAIKKTIIDSGIINMEIIEAATVCL